MSENTDECEQLIKDCEKRIKRLDNWSQGFIKSLRRQVDRGGVLNEAQVTKLNEAWDKATARG